MKLPAYTKTDFYLPKITTKYWTIYIFNQSEGMKVTLVKIISFTDTDFWYLR